MARSIVTFLLQNSRLPADFQTSKCKSPRCGRSPPAVAGPPPMQGSSAGAAGRDARWNAASAALQPLPPFGWGRLRTVVAVGKSDRPERDRRLRHSVLQGPSFCHGARQMPIICFSSRPAAALATPLRAKASFWQCSYRHFQSCVTDSFSMGVLIY